MIPASAMVILADDDTDKGSPIGLLVLLILVIAVYFLYRSMSRHVRGLPAKFDSASPAKQADGDTAADDVAEPAAPETPSDRPSAPPG